MSTLTLQSASRNFVKNAVTLRRESNVSVEEMAAATRLSAKTIRRIEKFAALGALAGNYRPQLSTVVKLANAASVTPDEILASELEVV
jgi:transcriptional regulator with XRE-family HTH domain